MRNKLGTLVLLSVLATSLRRTNAANILGVFPCVSRSHLTLHMAVVRALLERGHNITMVTSIALKEKHPNLHHIYIPPSDRTLHDIMFKKSQVSSARNRLQKMFKSMNLGLAMGPAQFDVLKHPTFQDFLGNPDNKFDLLIIGYFFNDYLFGLGVHFDCPIVISWVGTSNIFVGRYIGNPTELSYTASFQVLGEADPVKFTGRLRKFVEAVLSSMMVAVLNMQMMGFYSQLFPQPHYPSMEDAGKKVSLVLCNSHFSEGNIHPSVPALIEIGGIQIKDKPDPLPKDLADILDGAAEHGAVYVSLGSNIEANDLRPGAIESMFNVFSNLPQAVIWKWNCNELPGRSANIYCADWLPQNALLAHKNLRLFVTHGGKGSLSESQYHGVPVVAIPIFAEQPFNADALTRSGFGLQIDLFTITENGLRAAVDEVLRNSSYKQNVMRFAELYKDRPMSARDVAVYWTEYVIKHKGAYHMQSPLVHLNNLQYLFIDVIAFVFAVFFIGIWLIKTAVTWLWSRACRRRSSKFKMN